MAIFISYSHQDSDFVERLAYQLVSHKKNVWLDKWELRVGDSIINKIQSAIQAADALLVVLSKESVESEWCKKEITSGLLRELEEKRVVVLPILIQDCNIPIFLREKLYADFRKSYDEGLRTVLETIANITSDSLGRIDRPEYFVDYAVDWGMRNTYHSIRLTLLEQAKDQPYSVITEVEIIADDTGSVLYQELENQDKEELARFNMIELLVKEIDNGLDIKFVLSDSLPQKRKLEIKDYKSNAVYSIHLMCRRLGEDTGRDILVFVSNHLSIIYNVVKNVLHHNK